MTADSEETIAIAANIKRITFGNINGDVTAEPYTDLKGEVKQMAFSTDGKRLAVAYADGTLDILGFVPSRPEAIRVNDKFDPGKWAKLLSIPVSGVQGLAFGPDGNTLAAVGPKGVVVLGKWK